MNPLRIYDYLVTMRQRVLDAVRPLTPAQLQREFPFGLRTIGSTLTHVMISEWYYVERLAGREVVPYAQWPIKYETPPAFEVIEATWTPQARNVRASIAAERDWERPVTWISFPDQHGRRARITASAGDMMAQLVLHEVHHRAQVMAMLRMSGDGVKPLEDVDYNEIMYERRMID